MSVVKPRMVKVVAKSGSGSGSNSNRNNTVVEEHTAINHHYEYITTVDESSIATTTDDENDGGDSIAYVEDYEIAGNGDDEDGDAFFVEYVLEDENNLSAAPTAATVSGDSNGSEIDDPQEQQLTEYDDDDDGSDDGGGDLFNCDLCGMNFKSINDHMDEYHSGQDYVIDMSEENGATSIKTEKPLDLNDIDENDQDDDDNVDDEDGEETEFITADSTIRTADDEFTVYDESLEEISDEIIDDVLDDDNGEPDVYTYDDVTGRVTRTTVAKFTSSQRTIATKIGSINKSMNVSAVSVLKPSKRLVRTVREKPKIPKDSIVPNDHVCHICNTSFYSAKSLKLHARMHLPVKSKTLDEACDMEINATTGGEPEKIREKFYCATCGKHYDKTFERVHVEMHAGKGRFNCRICNKVFPNEESINMHMNAHQDTRIIKTKAELRNIKLPYACRFCGKEFARPHEKVKHERVHTGEKPYECELCGKCFRVSYCLTIHMRTHTDARPYVCPTCNKSFKAQSVYNHHLLTHSDERNYKCPYCPKTFKTSVQLSGHKNSHTKPFTCTECNRPFGSLYAVRAHMESHRRPNHNLKHICEICGAKYARRFALNDHMKEQHKDVQFVIVDTSNTKKPPAKRPKKVKQIKILEDDDERELEAAGHSILSDIVEQEITISEIENFDNEEEVVEMDDWLK